MLSLGVLLLADLINQAFYIFLLLKLKEKYPEVYKEYKEPSIFFSGFAEANFIGEFVVGGVFKHELEEVDFKYVTRFRWSLVLTLVIFVVSAVVLYSGM